MLRQVTAIRYVTPLREGGSLPGVVEADDLGTYVVKFRGAGQGPKALAAEVIAGELARGNVDADPAYRTPQDGACRWCAYASACYFRPGSGTDRRRILKKTSPAEVWQNIDEQLGKEARHDRS